MKFVGKGVDAIVDAIQYKYDDQKEVDKFLSEYGYSAKHIAERRINGRRFCNITKDDDPTVCVNENFYIVIKDNALISMRSEAFLRCFTPVL